MSVYDACLLKRRLPRFISIVDLPSASILHLLWTRFQDMRWYDEDHSVTLDDGECGWNDNNSTEIQWGKNLAPILCPGEGRRHLGATSRAHLLVSLVSRWSLADYPGSIPRPRG